MSILLDNLEDIDNIDILFEEDCKWLYRTDMCQDVEFKEDIDKFLSENIQFVKINKTTIVNLNYLEDYSLKGLKSYLIISKMKFEIDGKFIANIRAAKKKFQNSENTAILPTSAKGAWLYKVKQAQPDKPIATLIDAENIMYMLRRGSLTCVYYENEKKRFFFETLTYFEENLELSLPFVRVDRNCIINIKHIKSYTINSKTKIGEVNIDEQVFKISRRQLKLFRKKIKESNLVFTVQKIIK